MQYDEDVFLLQTFSHRPAHREEVTFQIDSGAGKVQKFSPRVRARNKSSSWRLTVFAKQTREKLKAENC